MRFLALLLLAGCASNYDPHLSTVASQIQAIELDCGRLEQAEAHLNRREAMRVLKHMQTTAADLYDVYEHGE
jgi:outer membrane murein-binding lipoprotein Lpp